MKTFKILSLILITFLSVSCGRDDDEPTPEPTVKDYLLSDKWYLQSASYYAVSACGRKSYFKFTADGSLVAQSYEVVSGACNDYGLNTGTYTLVDDNLTIINSSGVAQMVKIKSINNETMVFEGNSAGEIQTLIFDKTEG